RAEAIVNAAAEHDRPVGAFRPLDDQLVWLIEVRRVSIRGAEHQKNASFEFGVGGFGGSRAGVSPAQRTLEARSPSKMSHGRLRQNAGITHVKPISYDESIVRIRPRHHGSLVCPKC